MLLGAITISMSCNGFLQAPGIIAEKWFPVEEKVLATGLAIFSNTIGFSFGYLTSVYIVGGDDPN